MSCRPPPPPGTPFSTATGSRKECTSLPSAARTAATNAARSTTKPSAAPMCTWCTRRKSHASISPPTFGKLRKKASNRWDSIQEIQDLVAGTVQGRTSLPEGADQITVFNNNTGAGTQFAAVGAAVLKRARATRTRPRSSDRLVHRGRVSLNADQPNPSDSAPRADVGKRLGLPAALRAHVAQGLFPVPREFQFPGTARLAVVDRSGEVTVVVSDPWDAEALPGATFGTDSWRYIQGRRAVAIAGKEIMPQSSFTN